MNTYFFGGAALLYIVGALLPTHQNTQSVNTIACAWLLHGVALWCTIVAPGALHIGFAVMLSSSLWVSVAAYWLENRSVSLDGLRILVLPCAALGALLPLIFPTNIISLEGHSYLLSAHIFIAMLAYGTLTIATFHAALMLIQESSLHQHTKNKPWVTYIIENLPALLTMEKLLFRLIGFGFSLLTLTVLSGVFFSEQLFGRAGSWDHKTVFSVISWLLFGTLLAGRKWQGWRGKMALRFTLFGFITLLLAYVGSRFVLEIILHRGTL